MAAEITIAHLTDPHLDLGAPRGAELLGKRGLSWLSWRTRRRRIQRADLCDVIVRDIHAHGPDVIAMTGDLVNFALHEEFRRGRQWLERLGPAGRVAVVPGNHEALVPGMADDLNAAWGDYLAGDGAARGFPWHRDIGPVRLIGVSTARPSPPFFATGRIGAAQLERLDRLLCRTNADGWLAVVLIHHPPTDITAPRKALRDRAALRGIIADRGAGLVLHGHTHRAELSWLEGPNGRIPVLGAPSASWEPARGRDGAAWRLLRLTRRDGTWHLRMEERAAVAQDIAARTPLDFVLPSPSAAPLVAGAAPDRMPPGAP